MKFELQMGGSGNGITSAMKYFRCPEMWHRDEEAKARSGAASFGHGGMLAGTIYHAFLEIYRNLQHKYSPEGVEFIFPPGVDEPLDWALQRHEAERAFYTYQERYAPDLGGRLLYAEIPIEIDGLTARLDAVYDLPQYNQLGLSPGVWIVDDKLLARFGETNRNKYAYSPQGAWYVEASRLSGALPHDVQGVAFHIATKTKDVKFHVVPNVAWSQETIATMVARMREPRVRIKTYNCVDEYGYVCKYASSCLAGGK